MIEVLLSTYNGEKFLAEQLDSLLRQTVHHLKIRVRDDGSSDRTREILQEYAAKYPEKLSFTAGPNIGYAKSFLTLLEESTDANYFAFCDQDDVWNPNKLERATGALQTFADEPALYASSFERVDSQLNHPVASPAPQEVSFRAALVESLAYGCTMVMNRRARDLIATGSSSREAITHDWWCYLVINALGRVVYDPIPSLKYRQHGQNLLGAPPGLIKSWRNRLHRLKKKKKFTPWHRQALSLAAIYESQLSSEKLKTLRLIADARTSILARARLAFSNRIFRERRFDALVLRLLILFGAFSR